MNELIPYLDLNIFLVILVLCGEAFLVMRMIKRHRSNKKAPSVKVFNPQILLVSLPKKDGKSDSDSENSLGQNSNHQK